MDDLFGRPATDVGKFDVGAPVSVSHLQGDDGAAAVHPGFATLRPTRSATSWNDSSAFRETWPCSTRGLAPLSPLHWRQMIQLSKAIQLQRDWKAKGNPPCDHPETDKEYCLGADTGDEVCLTCGEAWPRRRGRPLNR